MQPYQRIILRSEVVKQIRFYFSDETFRPMPGELFEALSEDSNLKKLTESLEVSGPRASSLFQ
jgi:hypothetical protein